MGDPLGMQLTVMTYNIHSCVNFFGRQNPSAIARIIAAADPDIVALQEVESMNPGIDGDSPNQSEWLAERLNLHYHFLPLRPARWGAFGLAVLSRQPATLIKADRLPHADNSLVRESRGAMWLRLKTPHGQLNLVNTHLALQRRDRLVQIQTLLGPDWLGGPTAGEQVVLCGDLNAGVRSPVYRSLSAQYVDIQKQVRQWGYPRRTFYSFYPLLRLDHIFVSRHLSVQQVAVPMSLKARMASDHLPVWARLTHNGIK